MTHPKLENMHTMNPEMVMNMYVIAGFSRVNDKFALHEAWLITRNV